MDSKQILQSIDDEISRLQQAKALLGDRGGFVGSGKAKKRTLSPEARAKIAAAQKKRWAAQKKKSK